MTLSLSVATVFGLYIGARFALYRWREKRFADERVNRRLDAIRTIPGSEGM